ncbi:MAG: hypothetical protein WCA35_06820 [Kovacikia sp.]
MNEQLLLFDLAPCSIQRPTAEDEALSDEGVQKFRQIEYKQLELDLFPRQPDEAPLKTLGLAA